MPLTQEQKNGIITQMGYNPAEYDVDEATQSLVSRQPVSPQPSTGTTIYQPKLESGYRPVQQPSSASGAFATSAMESAPGAIAGGIGAAIGSGAMMGEMNPLAHVLPPYSEIAGGLIGAGIGAFGARALQKQLEPEQFQQQVATAQQQHPIASLAGGLATLPLGGFGPNSIRNLGSAAGAIPKLLTGMELNPNELAQVVNIGLGAGLGAAQPIAESEIEGKGMPSTGSILGNAAIGGLFSKPNAIGRGLGFHNVDVPDEVFTKNLLQAMGGEQPKQAAIDTGLGNLPTRYTKPEAELTKEEQYRLSLEGGHNISGSLEGAPFRGKAMARYKTNPESMQPDVDRMSGEGGPEPEQDIKYQEKSNISTQAEQDTLTKLKQEGLTGNLTPEWFDVAKALGKKRGVDLQLNPDLETAGRTTIPTDRSVIQNVLAEVNPKTAGADTPVHEIQHIFRNDLRNSPRARDQQFVARYDKLAETVPDYQRWKALRDAAGKDSSVEEYETTNQGVESINRALSDETKFQKWKNDFGGYLKTRWGKNATQEDYQRIMNYKLLNDPAFYKITGQAPSGGIIKQQEESNINRVPEEEQPIKDETGKVNELYKRGDITLDQAEKLLIGNPKNQTESNLVSPQHDSIKEAINEGVNDENLTPERADILENALKTQVKWPTESAIPAILNGKQDLHNTYGDIGKFDNLDQDHWKQLRQIYNNEYDTYGEKTSTEQLAPKPSTSKIEVPRVIPEVATEAGKAAKETSVKSARLKQTTEVKDLTQVPGKVVGERPKGVDESIFRKESAITPEERNRDLNASKMSWAEIDNTTNPQDTMDKLKQQYDSFGDRQHEAFAQGDRDTANKLADLRTATLMRMHYLGEKKGVEVPETEKYQDISNLKLPNLHNRVEEFGKKPPEESLPYLTPKMFTTQLDKIRKTGGKTGQEFADEYERYAPLKDQLYGKYWAPIQKAMKGLSRDALKEAEQVMVKENRDKKDYRDYLSPKQQKYYDAVRSSLLQKQKDQIEAGQLVTDYDSKGVKFQRPAQIDPYYYPNKISPKVAEQLAENTPASQKLKQDFLQHQKQMGISDNAAQQKLQAIESAYDAAKPNMTRFGAVREAEGVGLPDSWMRNDPAKNLSSYFSRVSADRAFHDTFESNKDLYNAAFKGEDSGDLTNATGNKHIKALAEQIQGEPFDKDESWIKAFNRVATSLMLGPLTNVHIAASSVANSLQYLKPSEAIPALTKAIVNITDGYSKALEAGRIKPSNTHIRDVVDINNTAVEKWRAAADMIGKINGRDATMNFTNAFLQNIGEWIIHSKAIAASAGDKSAIDLMRRVDPDWTVNKSYTTPDFEKLSSNFAGIIHGSHDARTLPGWMLKDTAIQPFFSLASWNIAQTNAWVRHVLTPAKDGNFTPLIMSTLGSVLGGYVIKQGREFLNDKKSPIPSLSEIVNSSRGVEGNIPLIAYNLAAMSSYVGFAGILSVAAKAGFDLANKNIPQAATFPLDETIGNSAHRMSQAVAALMNDPNANYLQVGSRLAIDLAKENVQLGRLLISWGSNNKDISNVIPGMEQEAYSKQLNTKTQDLRRFKMVEGMPYDEQSVSESNPYLSSQLKTFKRSQDVGESAQQLPQLFQTALTKANGNPDVLKAELHKIKANTYETMPDPDRMPLSFIRYLNFLRNTQGPEEASDRLIDYMKHKAINEAKSSMVPSL